MADYDRAAPVSGGHRFSFAESRDLVLDTYDSLA